MKEARLSNSEPESELNLRLPDLRLLPNARAAGEGKDAAVITDAGRPPSDTGATGGVKLQAEGGKY